MNQQSFDIFAGVENKREHLVKILWSGFYFALSYIIISYLSYLLQAFNASVLGYDAAFSFDGIKITGGTDPWSLKRVAFVFLTPPLFGILTSIAGSIAFASTNFNKSHLKLFFYWLAMNGFVFFYSYFFTGILSFGLYNSKYFTGFAVFLAWLYLERGTISILLLILAGIFTLYAFVFGTKTLSLNYSTSLYERRYGRSIVFINVVLLPFIVGVSLLTVTTYPMDFNYNIIRLLSYPIIFFIVFIWLKLNLHNFPIIKKEGIAYRSFFLLAMLSGILVAARIVLGKTLVL